MSDDRPEGAGPDRWEPAPDLLPSTSGPDPTVADRVEDPDGHGAVEPPTSVLGATPADPPAPEVVPAPPVEPPPVPPVEGDDADDPADRKPNPLVVAAVGLAVLAAVVVGAVLLTRGGEKGTDTADSTTSTTQATTTSTTVLERERELLPGVRAVISADSLTPGATLAAERVSLPGDLGALVDAGPIVGLRVEGGEMIGSVRLIFDLGANPVAPPDGEPVVLGLEEIDRRRSFPAGHHDRAAGTFELDVTETGVVGPLTWDWSGLAEDARATSLDLAEGGGDGPAAECADDLPAEEVSTTGDGVEWCAAADGDGRRVVAVNRTALPLTIGWTGTVEVRRDPGTATISGVGTGVENWTTDSSVTLAPGERVRFLASGTEATSFTASLDDVAEAGASLLVAAAHLVDLGPQVPGADGPRTVQGVLDRVGDGCAPPAGSRPSGTLGSCFPAEVQASILGSPAAQLTGPVLVSDVLGVVYDGAFDSVSGTAARRANGTLELAAVTRWSWPTGEVADDEALSAWSDETGFALDWSRCSADRCVAGLGDGRVALLQVRAGRVTEAVELDEATDDPYQELLHAGIRDSLATRLLDAG